MRRVLLLLIMAFILSAPAAVQATTSDTQTSGVITEHQTLIFIPTAQMTKVPDPTYYSVSIVGKIWRSDQYASPDVLGAQYETVTLVGKSASNSATLKARSGPYWHEQNSIRWTLPAGTATPTFTKTHTPTFTTTLTNSNTYTPTNSPTNTPTNTPTNSPTNSPTNTATKTPTDSPTNTTTNTPTETPTDTPTSTITDTPSVTNTCTDSPTDTPTSTCTDSPTSTPTSTVTDTPTDTLSPTPTTTDTPTFIPGAVGRLDSVGNHYGSGVTLSDAGIMSFPTNGGIKAITGAVNLLTYDGTYKYLGGSSDVAPLLSMGTSEINFYNYQSPQSQVAVGAKFSLYGRMEIDADGGTRYRIADIDGYLDTDTAWWIVDKSNTEYARFKAGQYAEYTGLMLSNNAKIMGVPTPSTPTDAANKTYVDAVPTAVVARTGTNQPTPAPRFVGDIYIDTTAPVTVYVGVSLTPVSGWLQIKP